jgi:hypothetical protein
MEISAPIDVPSEEFAGQLWRAGRLADWKLDPHQLDVHSLFIEWNEFRQTQEYLDLVLANDTTLDDVWVEEIGRRFGKTAKWLIVLAEIAITRVGAVLMYGTAYQKDISEIIVPLANQLFADAPDDVRPRYQRSKQGGNEGLYFPNTSVIKLVGLDEHPDAARGRFSDGIVLSEAGFMKGLEDLVRSVLLPQFQRRPWAFLACESSTSKETDHDFMRVFVPDAKLRRAYVMRTIDDNVVLGDREKAKHIRMAGGRGSVTCEREYYCVQMRDPQDLVIPEFSPKAHVRDWKRPEFAYCMTAADPGMQDLFGQVWGYWDWQEAKLVIERSWAQRNASTRKVAAVNAAMEYEIWGVHPPARMRHIPLRTTEERIGWVDLLKGERVANLAFRMHQLANAERRPELRWEVGHPPGHFTFWDGAAFVQNPYMRFSDIELRLMQDLSVEYDMLFNPTAKDDVEAQINLVRDWFADGRIVFLPDAGPVIEHVGNALWNDKRTDWQRHKVFGHYDCLSALVYLVRNINNVRARKPSPPQFTDRRAHDVATMFQPPFIRDEVRVLSDAFGANDNGVGAQRRWRG